MSASQGQRSTLLSNTFVKLSVRSLRPALGSSAFVWRPPLSEHHPGAGNIDGWFKDFSGPFVIDSDPKKSRVEVVAKMVTVG